MKNLSLILAVFALMAMKCKEDLSDCVCIEIYAPVCGEDGVQYDNSCFAECEGVEYTDGFCPVETTGIINYHDPAADGCGWTISIATGDIVGDYKPSEALAEEFKEQDLEVNLTYKTLLEGEDCGFGTIAKIEILEIEKK